MARPFVIACLLIALVVAAPAHAASLDTSFGKSGRVVLDFGEDNYAIAGDLAVQPDGKIVAVGWVKGQIGFARLLANGALDPSFGSGGIALTGFGLQAREAMPPRLALQPDGAIVAVGMAANPGALGKYDFGVVRVTKGGQLDPAFAQGGSGYFQVGPKSDVAQDVAVQPDGKLVVAGYSLSADGNSDFAAIRLTPTGGIDTSFGTGGSAVIPMDPDSGMDSASAVGLTPDGRIVIAGVTARSETGFDVATVRLTTAGALDPSFGGDGRAELALGSGAWQEIVRSLLVAPDGSLYVGGSALQPGFGPSLVALTHFTAEGVPDWSALRALGTLEDTSSGIVLAGQTTYLAADSRTGGSEREAGVLALDASGLPDASFSPGGELLFHLTPGANDRAAAIATRADGALVELFSTNEQWAFAVIVPASTKPVPPPSTQTETPATNPPSQSVTLSSKITFPRSGAKLRRVRVLRGTASATLPLARVDFALAKLSGRTCLHLKTAKPGWVRARCSRLIWKRASGRNSWSYTLKRALPKGSYRLYSRAVAGGVREAQRAAVKFRVS